MKKKILVMVLFLLVGILSLASAEEWVCPSCNAAANGNFCSNCGEKKPDIKDIEWICPGCGNNASGYFCNNCGRAKPDEDDHYIDLGKMEVFQRKTEGGSWATYTDRYDEYLEDNYGNTYSHSVSVGTGSLTYLVNYSYLSFTGTVAFPKGAKCDGYRSSATLRIYGDGELIAEFKDFNDGSRPETFSINIKQYERLTLKWTCKGSNIWHDWGYFATVFDGKLVPVP